MIMNVSITMMTSMMITCMMMTSTMMTCMMMTSMMMTCMMMTSTIITSTMNMMPKIDRSDIDRPTLPCKIIKVTENNQYILGSRYGIINIYYSPGEIEPLGTNHFSELDNIPHNEISVREASHL